MSDKPATTANNVKFARGGLRLVILSFLAGAALSVPAFVVGYVGGQLHNDVARGDRDVDAVQDIVAAGAERYAALSISRGPGDKFLLQGEVESSEDLENLRKELIRSLGESRTEYILQVSVSQDTENG